MICICSEFYAEAFDNKPCRVRLGRASREGWKAPRVRDEYVKQGFLLSKGEWIKRTKNTLHIFDTNVRKLYFGVKVSVPTVSNCIFWFSLKLCQQFAPLKGLGELQLLCINCIFFAPFLYPFC